MFEGYASEQLRISLRRAIERIFVGVPYPPHAAHHNYASTLLYGALRGDAVEGLPERFQHRILPALNLARRATSREAVRLREEVASGRALREIDLDDVWRAFDRWLSNAASQEHATLATEADSQRADFIDFLETKLAPAMGSRAHLLVGAWKPARTSNASDLQGDADYAELFETLVERALAFVASRDGDARMFVHVAKRTWNRGTIPAQALARAQASAAAHPLLARAAKNPLLLEPVQVDMDERAHAGFVIADFIANRLRRMLVPTRSWADVAGAARAVTGLSAAAPSSLVRSRDPLPAITGTGDDRAAIRLAVGGKARPPTAGPLWSRQQAELWIKALDEGATP